MATPITLQECEVNLNINIPSKVWEENPKFASLLTELATKKLAQFSIHRSTWETYESRSQESLKANIKLFYHALLFDTILSILYEKSVDDSSVGLMASHALDYISIQESANTGPAIVPKQYIDSFIKEMDNPEGLKMLKEAIVPEIQKILEEHALKLLQLRDSTVDSEKPSLWLAKLNQLPSLIEQEIKLFDENKRSKKVLNKTIAKNLEILTEKQVEYSKAIQAYQDEFSEYTLNKESLEGNWILSKFQTMMEKLEGLDKQLQVETYTPEDVKALEIIHQSLIEMKQNITQEIAETKTILNSYGALGPEFTKIVEEYSEIAQQIEAARDVLLSSK